MTGFAFAASCPDCGGALDHRCEARISPTRTCAEVFCPACLMVLRVDVQLERLSVTRLFDDPRSRAADALGNEAMGVFV